VDSAGKPGKGAQTAAAAILTGISTAEENGKVVVTVYTKGPVDYKAFTLSQPRRLVVDFINAEVSVPFRELPVNLANLKQIRIRQFESEGSRIARLVFDLAEVKRVNHQIVAEGQTVKILLPSKEMAAGTLATEPPQQKSVTTPKAEPPTSKATAAPAQKQATTPGTPATSKAPSPDKPAAASKPKNPAVKNTAIAAPKPPEATLPAKAASTDKPTPTPKQEVPAAKPAAPDKQKLAARVDAPAPAKATSPEKSTVAPKAEGTPAKTASIPNPKPVSATEAAATTKAPTPDKPGAPVKKESRTRIEAVAPAKTTTANKPAAVPKPDGIEARAASVPKQAPASVAGAASTTKTPPTEKPAASAKKETPAVQKPKPAATTESAVPSRVQPANRPPVTPKPEGATAKTASTPTQRPASALATAAPAKTPKREQAVAEAEPERRIARPAPASKEAPAPTRAPANTPAVRPIEVAEIQNAGRVVALKAPKVESAPIQVPSTPPQPVPPAPAAPSTLLAPAQESRFGGTPLTLDLIDIPLVDFFRLMAEEGGINIVMDPQITGTISIKVVKVPWDQILEAALANNGLDKQVEGNLVRIAKKTTLQQEAKQREDLKKATLLAADVETRIKRLNYAKAASFVPALTEQKTVRGTVVVDERSNSLVLTDIPNSVDKMIKLIEALDLPQAQVEIEARIVSANRDFARDLGVQFGFVQGNLQRVTVGGPNTFGTIGGTRPSATPTNTFAAGNSQTGRGASEAQSSTSAGVSTGTSSQNAGNFNVNLPAGKAFGGLGLSIGNILDTFLLDAAITAGESKGLAKLISQPKVTAQNNSSATITQGLRFPVQIVANNTITVQFQNAALTLIVTPQITLEGNIVLDLHIENNTPDFSRAVNGIPSVRTSESTTRVLVSDGGTTVIGGIIIESDSNSSDRVPGAASLPLVGNLFKRTSTSRSSQEVLFFVTPRIVK
jgi:type IV pilus assembly protein PilQ